MRENIHDKQYYKSDSVHIKAKNPSATAQMANHQGIQEE
jgi:hypothetical protein